MNTLFDLILKNNTNENYNTPIYIPFSEYS